ncbi:uncharacterized protein [Euphorbia lathyris]|uniref:uncharacterized protein n=1 Tax=Euphorbia lathyris TaxID=212925 RepID=UPI0033137E7A
MFCFCFNSLDSAQKTKEHPRHQPIPQLPAKDKQTDSAKKTKEQPIRYLPAVDEQTEVIRELRDLPPVHYLFEIQNFSHLLNAKRQSFQSSDFVVAGYTWRLRLSHYPQGNKNLVNEKQYLSLYLRLSESNSLPKDMEIDVFFQLFVYNQVQDNYLTVKGRVRRFRGIKSEWGFDELLPLDVFKDESNGYLIKDRCVFGAEIFVLDSKNIRRGESVSVVKELGDNTFTWNIQNFEKLKVERYRSEVFAIGGYKWSLEIYPNGESKQKGKNLSAFLYLEDSEALDPGEKLNVEYLLRIRDQFQEKHHELFGCNNHFSASTPARGSSGFMPLTKLNDKSRGYIVNGVVILQVQISLLTMLKMLTSTLN